jgi:uncharacterized protein involved in exopolysaccharide biosynthesis
MIRPLRRRHLWLVAMVAVAAGVLVSLALAARPEYPLQSELSGRAEAGVP